MNARVVHIVLLFYYNFSFIFYLAIRDELFEHLKQQRVVKFIKTCKEINIAFIAYEKQVNFIFIHFIFLVVLDILPFSL